MKLLTSSQVYTICQFAGVNTQGMNNTVWDSDGSGCDAVFVKIDDNYGLKAFHSETVAKISYHYNRIFSHFGYTPKAWGLSSVTIRGHEFFYFFTEICEEYDGESESNSYEDSDGDYHENDSENFNSELGDFEDNMQQLTGFRNSDIHPGNYGFLHGELVCIDVGHIAYRYLNDEGYESRITPKWA